MISSRVAGSGVGLSVGMGSGVGVSVGMVSTGVVAQPNKEIAIITIRKIFRDIFPPIFE